MNTIYNTPCGGVRSGFCALMRMDIAKALKGRPTVARVFADAVSFECKEEYSKLFLTRLKNIANTAVGCMLLYRNHSKWIRGYYDGVP